MHKTLQRSQNQPKFFSNYFSACTIWQILVIHTREASRPKPSYKNSKIWTALSDQLWKQMSSNELILFEPKSTFWTVWHHSETTIWHKNRLCVNKFKIWAFQFWTTKPVLKFHSDGPKRIFGQNYVPPPFQSLRWCWSPLFQETHF